VADEERGEPDVAYMLPRHPAELDRLDVQHYGILEALRRNYLAPVGSPARILDVGSGTGQWAHEVAREFPRAAVVGLDLEPGKDGAPANYHVVLANLLGGLPFADGSFDYVHQRLMAISAIPLPAWPAVLADLVRVTAPGGWVELVEALVAIEPAGPATSRLLGLTRRLGRTFGVDMDAVVVAVLGDHLRRAGLVDVEQRTVSVPIGEWGGRAGSLFATNMRVLHIRLADAFEDRMGISEPEFNRLLHAMLDEWERHRSRGTFVLAYGRKPANVAT